MLLSNPSFMNGLGMDIHIRTKAMHKIFSYIETAAIRIGEDILEVSSYGTRTLNRVTDVELPFFMADRFMVTHEQVNKKINMFHIKLPESEEIVVKTVKNMVTISIQNADAANFGDSVGMMGQHATGALVGRDGVTIHEDTNAFAQEWQINPEIDSQLFVTTDSYPQYPARRVMPDATEQARRRLGQADISKADAEEACAHFGGDQKTMCVYDVMATGDLDAAIAF